MNKLFQATGQGLWCSS